MMLGWKMPGEKAFLMVKKSARRHPQSGIQGARSAGSPSRRQDDG